MGKSICPVPEGHGAFSNESSGVVLTKISELIFDLFVVNTESIACQIADGSYRRRTVPVSPFLIRAMLDSCGSMGCYQQQPRTGFVRWVCLDFDCADKDDPDITGLYREVIEPLAGILDELGIRFLLEFSGRRGIHVWVLFDRIVSKDLGYRVVVGIERCLTSRVGELGQRWRLDRFPATGSAKGNVVGKQVKLPLSCHRAGGRSFFFCGEEELAKSTERAAGADEAFYLRQLEILVGYKENKADCVLKSLGIVDGPYATTRDVPVAKKYRTIPSSVIGSSGVSVDGLVTILSELGPFDEIFSRLRRGVADARDRSVILGTLSAFEDGPELLREVLKRFPCYDREKTEKAVARLKDRYHPATIGYLRDLYGLPATSEIDDETGFTYILKRLGVDPPPEEPSRMDERCSFGPRAETIDDAGRRERSYLSNNDEVRDALIDNDLQRINEFDSQRLADAMKQIMMNGPSNSSPCPSGYRVYHRLETSGKVRELVSLSARDRLLTTHLAMRLCAVGHKTWDSYSYHVALMSRTSIFFPWYSSWKRYLWQVRCFFDIEFFEEYEVFFIDLEGFYDHIDFLSVYRAIGESMGEEERNIFEYLVSFNEKLMGEMHGGLRIGVPQGPAYARIIAELFLDEVIRKALAGVSHEDVSCYRYVDDMLFVCRPGYDSRGLFERVVTFLNSYGLPVSSQKSCCYGAIGDLTDSELSDLRRDNSFNYDLHEGSGDYALTESERRAKLATYLEAQGRSLDIDLLGYYFGRDVVPSARDWFFNEHFVEVIRSKEGRGVNYARFYRYAFASVERIEKLISSGALSSIPVGSINYSNCINELYLACKEGNVAVRDSLGAIVSALPESLGDDVLDDHDRTIVRALLRLSTYAKGAFDVGD